MQLVALDEDAPVERVEVDGVGGPAGQRFAQDVAGALAAQGREASAAPQPGGDPVVHLLGRKALQLGVVQQPFGHRADVHLDQPAVDDVVGGDVEEIVVAGAAPPAVTQGGVQHLVGEDEPPLLVREPLERVDVDLACGGVHGSHGDVVRAGEFGVGDDGQSGRESAEQRVGRDEPVEGAVPGALGDALTGEPVPAAARDVHRGGDRTGQGVREGELPVGQGGVPARPLDQQLVGFAVRAAAPFVGGRDVGLAPAGGELLLVAVGVALGKVVGGGADGEGGEEAVDDGAAGGEVEAVGLLAELLGGGEVTETEVEESMGERPGPLAGFGPAGGVDVHPPVGVRPDEALAGGVGVALGTDEVGVDGCEGGVAAHQVGAGGEGLGGRVGAVRAVLAGSAQRRASTRRGMSRAASTRNQAGSTGLPSASSAMTVWATSTEISASWTSSDLAR